MIKVLAKIANKLDSLGLSKEADVLDSYIKKEAYAVPVQTIYENTLQKCYYQKGCKIVHSGITYESLGDGTFMDNKKNIVSFLFHVAWLFFFFVFPTITLGC